jgi:4-hydroxybenzoate polyprenyltransferase
MLNRAQVVFACATAPIQSFFGLFRCCVWVWFHLLLCNVSNQARSREEDRVNHPWRPLPSGRISESKAVALRWVMVAFCIYLSSIYDQDLVMTTLGLVVTTFTYDELGGSGNIVGKALCTAAGYSSFELGATTIIGM